MIISLGVIFLSAVAYHSVEEIHYLKSFFPKEFTVEGAMQASIVEGVKIVIISIPVVVIISVCLSFLRHYQK